jgi:glycosyltransferase involved in cell wall biosynthesis
MRFHLLAPANVQTTKKYNLDGFNMATIRFARVLKSLGHTVFLYASEFNDAPCDELITVISSKEQHELTGGTDYYDEIPAANHPEWMLSNSRIIGEITKRKQPRDFICSIGGVAQKAVADAHPDLFFVEYSVGYPGTFSPYRVFESQAWRHFIYGQERNLIGRNFEDVIPCFFDKTEYRLSEKKENFLLFVGRVINLKGVSSACQVAKKSGLPLKVIGYGEACWVTDGAEYLGPLGDKERNEYMSKARALICPTQYVEPFGCVAVEAQLCGTPVISTDFGGFTETVEEAATGFRCRYMGEFLRATEKVLFLDPVYIQNRARNLYSLEAAAVSYQRYFTRLGFLHDKGWYHE